MKKCRTCLYGLSAYTEKCQSCRSFDCWKEVNWWERSCFECGNYCEKSIKGWDSKKCLVSPNERACRKFYFPIGNKK